MNVYLIEFHYPSDNYAYELSNKLIADPEVLQTLWCKHNCNNDPETSSCWEISLCEAEPLMELSEMASGEWCWRTGIRYWLGADYKLLYLEEMVNDTFEESQAEMLEAFTRVKELIIKNKVS